MIRKPPENSVKVSLTLWAATPREAQLWPAHQPDPGFCSHPPALPQAVCPAGSPSAPSAPSPGAAGSPPTGTQQGITAHFYLWSVFWHLWSGRKRDLEGKITTRRIYSPKAWEFTWTDMYLKLKFPGVFRRMVTKRFPNPDFPRLGRKKKGRILQYTVITKWHC